MFHEPGVFFQTDKAHMHDKAFNAGTLMSDRSIKEVF